MLIEQERFDVFLTGDKNMQNQRRLENRSFAVLVITAINWPVVRPYIAKISFAISQARAGTVSTIDCGVFFPRLKRLSDRE